MQKKKDEEGGGRIVDSCSFEPPRAASTTRFVDIIPPIESIIGSISLFFVVRVVGRPRRHPTRPHLNNNNNTSWPEG